MAWTYIPQSVLVNTMDITESLKVKDMVVASSLSGSTITTTTLSGDTVVMDQLTAGEGGYISLEGAISVTGDIIGAVEGDGDVSSSSFLQVSSMEGYSTSARLRR